MKDNRKNRKKLILKMRRFFRRMQIRVSDAGRIAKSEIPHISHKWARQMIKLENSTKKHDLSGGLVQPYTWVPGKSFKKTLNYGRRYEVAKD